VSRPQVVVLALLAAVVVAATIAYGVLRLYAPS
jgi:hypothetical protein